LKRPYYDKFQCHKLQEDNFRVPGRLYEVSSSTKSWIPCSHPVGPVKRPNTLLCREDSDSLACIHLDVRATLFERRLGKIACNRPNARATLSGPGLNMEILDERYGKAVAQFTVHTLYGFVQTPSIEICINGVLGLLSLQIEASRHVLFTEFGIEFSRV